MPDAHMPPPLFDPPEPVFEPTPGVPDRYQPNAPTRLVIAALEYVREADARQLWSYARTMPQWPHQYTVRQRSKAAGLGAGHESLWIFTRDFHYDRWWGNRSWRTVDLGGWQLWIVDDGMIINRAPAELDAT